MKVLTIGMDLWKMRNCSAGSVFLGTRSSSKSVLLIRVLLYLISSSFQVYKKEIAAQKVLYRGFGSQKPGGMLANFMDFAWVSSGFQCSFMKNAWGKSLSTMSGWLLRQSGARCCISTVRELFHSTAVLPNNRRSKALLTHISLI